jgi:hypothetical protein
MAKIAMPKDLGAVPAPLEFLSFPEVKKLHVRVEELADRRDLVQRRIGEVERHISAGKGRHDRVAVDLLTAPTLPESDLLGQGSLAALKEELTRLRSDDEALGRAIEEGKRQLADLRRKLAPAACEKLRAFHRDLSRAMAAHITEALRLVEAEKVLLDKVSAAGYQMGHVTANWCNPVFLGQPGDPQSPVAHWLRDMVQQGYLAHNDPLLSGSGLGTGEQAELGKRPGLVA